MSNEPELLRKQIHNAAKKMGIFDNRNPSKLYCSVIINHMAEVMEMDVAELHKQIHIHEARNQGSKP